MLTQACSVLEPNNAPSVIKCFASMLVLRSKLVVLQRDLANHAVPTSPMAHGVQRTPAKKTDGKKGPGASPTAKDIEGAGTSGVGESTCAGAGAGAGGGQQNLARCDEPVSVWPLNPNAMLCALPQTECPVLSDLPMIRGRYHNLKHLATTRSADVCTAVCIRTGALTVLKRLNCSADAALKQVVMAGLVNGVEGIAPLLDVARDGHDGRIVLCYPHLQPMPTPMSVQDIYRHTISVLRTLDSLHKRGIVHMDLKPDHVMLNAQNEAELIDTGISCVFPALDEDRCLPAVGTHRFAAPEVLLSLANDGCCDVFSFGRTLECWLALRETAVTNDVQLLAQLEECLPRMLADEPCERWTPAQMLAALKVNNPTRVSAPKMQKSGSSKLFASSSESQRRPLSAVN